MSNLWDFIFTDLISNEMHVAENPKEQFCLKGGQELAVWLKW
jgi:hypothetical protein